MTVAARAAWRVQAEALIEWAIAVLDEVDGDADLEDGRDFDPYLEGRGRFVAGSPH
jgi:hypothetical protein